MSYDVTLHFPAFATLLTTTNPSSRTCLELSVYHVDLASSFWLGMAWLMFVAWSLCLHSVGSIASLASCILLKALGIIGWGLNRAARLIGQ